MQIDNIHTIISNSLTVSKDKLDDLLDDLMKQIEVSLNINGELIQAANQIDCNNHNGFPINISIFSNILHNLQKEDVRYGSVSVSRRDSKENFFYGKQIMDKGNVVVIDEGNPYTLFEMSIRNLLAGNTTIFVNHGFMYGTNQLLIQILQDVLEQFHLSRYFVQIYCSDEIDEVFKNFANIDLIVCIGNHTLQKSVLEKSKNPVIVSGYENYDIYVEDKTHLDFLNQLIQVPVSYQVYIHKDLDIDYPNAILVDDIDEAIAQIHYNGSHFAAAIFTNSTEHASQFIKEVKASYVVVNTSPTIERVLDIRESDLTCIKTIIYPSNNEK